MGLNRKRGALSGLLRTTYYSEENGQQVLEKGLADLQDDPGDIYRTNIQTGELNALNASLAVIKFKQIRGFYVEEDPNYHQLFDVSDCQIVAESELQ
jgi:hypothetical protein